MSKFNTIPALRAELRRLNRLYDAAEYARNEEAMEQIAMQQISCEDEIERLELRNRSPRRVRHEEFA